MCTGNQGPDDASAIRLSQCRLVYGGDEETGIAFTGSVFAQHIPQAGKAHRFIQDDPVLYPVAKS